MEDESRDGLIENIVFQHFKLPLLVTVITMILMTIIGIALTGPAAPAVDGLPDQRAAALGQGLGLLAVLIAGPFWVYGVLAAGHERRAALKRTRPPAANPRRKSKR